MNPVTPSFKYIYLLVCYNVYAFGHVGVVNIWRSLQYIEILIMFAPLICVVSRAQGSLRHRAVFYRAVSAGCSFDSDFWTYLPRYITLFR